jgi:hypothetical protein
MLTVLVITFIVAKYLNNSRGVFLIPDIKKRIKTTIQDPESAAAMLGAVSSAQLAGKRLDRRLTAYRKLLALLIEDRYAPRQELEAIFRALMHAQHQFQRELIEGRLVFANYMTREEFSIFTDPSSRKTSNNQRASEKRLEKIRIETNMRLKGINTMALAIIDAPERRAKVASAVEDYRVKMDNLLGGLTEWNFRDNSVLKNFDASKAQLWEIFEKLNSLREACFAAFIELYFQLASLSSDDEWNTATKAMKSLI